MLAKFEGESEGESESESESRMMEDGRYRNSVHIVSFTFASLIDIAQRL